MTILVSRTVPSFTTAPEDQSLDRAQELGRAMRYAKLRYEQGGEPWVSDDVFDAWHKELVTLEALAPEFKLADSPSSTTGAAGLSWDDAPSSSGAPQRQRLLHSSPMGSISNLEIKGDGAPTALRDFLRDVSEDGSPVQVCCELKMDGIACALRYKGGTLVSALTRSGQDIQGRDEGEDILIHVNAINDIPKRLPGAWGPDDEVEIRGEVYMLKSRLADLNALRAKAGLNLYKNPRNTASGLTQRLTHSDVPTDGNASLLSFMAYKIVTYPSHAPANLAPPKTQKDVFRLTHALGFPPPLLVAELDREADIRALHQDIERGRNALPFDIDGMVIKVNDFDRQKALGMSGDCPRWACAYKFKPEEALTEILRIETQVGKTGKITPVAVVRPVKVGGVEVSSATLNNEAWMLEQFGTVLSPGDRVTIARNGDVIPGVQSLVSTAPGPEPRFKMPSQCPACGHGPLSLKVNQNGEAGSHLYCTSDQCGAQKSLKVLGFVSKATGFDMGGIGEVTVDGLYAKGLVDHPLDILRLTLQDFLTLDGFGPTSAKNAMESVDKVKTLLQTTHCWPQMVRSLGVPGVSEGTTLRLSRTFKTFDEFLAADRETLLGIRDVGDITADNLINYFSNPVNTQAIQRLRDMGCWPSVPRPEQDIHPGIHGRSFLLTGGFSSKTRRHELEEIIKQKGGTVASKPNEKLYALIAGASGATASKVAAARDAGRPVWDEQQLQALIDCADHDISAAWGTPPIAAAAPKMKRRM